MCCQNDKWKGSDVVDCEKNSYAPEGEPLHQIVEEFADNQEAWFKVLNHINWTICGKLQISFLRTF